jgi:hypothetical protein
MSALFDVWPASLSHSHAFAAEFGATTAQSSDAALAVSVNSTSFNPGQTMTVTAKLTSGSAPSQVDAYVIVQLPTGHFLSLQLGGGLVPGIVPIARGFAPFAYDAPLAQYTFNGSEPIGTYLWHFGLTQPGTMEFIGQRQQIAFTFSRSTPALTITDLSAALRAGQVEAASKLTGNAALEGLREVDPTARTAIADALVTCDVVESTPSYEVCATSDDRFRFFMIKDEDGVWRVIVW